MLLTDTLLTSRLKMQLRKKNRVKVEQETDSRWNLKIALSVNKEIKIAVLECHFVLTFTSAYNLCCIVSVSFK